MLVVTERWRKVIGYEESYEVSSLGKVRSVDRILPHSRYGTWKLNGRILHTILSGGYLAVNLSKEGTSRYIRIHRLVAAAWIGPCPEGQQVRHGPNGKLDNSISNLCYGTPSEDGLDKRRDGTHIGKAVRRSDGVEFISMTVAAEETGCGRVCVSGLFVTGVKKQPVVMAGNT